MGSQSDSPPDSVVEKPQNPGLMSLNNSIFIAEFKFSFLWVQ